MQTFSQESPQLHYLSLFEKPNSLLDPGSAHTLSSIFATLGQNGQKLLGQVIEATRVGLASSIHGVFIVGTLILLSGLIISCFLPVINLETEKEELHESERENPPAS